MSTNVKVSGIPSKVKLGRLIPLFSNILSVRSSDFLLRMLPSSGPIKDVLLSFPSHHEAASAQEKLDNFVYKHNFMTYVFTAKMDIEFKQTHKKPRQKPKNHNQNFRQSYDEQYGSQYEQEFGHNRSSSQHYEGESSRLDRSHSPHYEEESARLDMQIEILRKQRMIIEEERKLLEEQIKLDQLKMESFNNYIPPVSNKTNDDIEMSEPTSNPVEQKFDPEQHRATFSQASGVILKKMNMFIEKHSSAEERKALLSHLRSILNKRLADVVSADGQSYYWTQKMVLLYRMIYPISRDDYLVQQAIADIRQGRWTEDTKIVKASTENAIAKNESVGAMNNAGDTLQIRNATTKDTTTSGGDTNVCQNLENKTAIRFEQKRLNFQKASTVLIRKMNIFMDLHCPTETRKLLLDYLRYTLKKRLANIVYGTPIYQTYKIVKIYRSQHPRTEDQDFIKQLLKDIEENRVPEEVFSRDVTPKTSEQEKAAADENIAKDKEVTAEGKNDKSDQQRQNTDADENSITDEVQRLSKDEVAKEGKSATVVSTAEDKSLTAEEITENSDLQNKSMNASENIEIFKANIKKNENINEDSPKGLDNMIVKEDVVEPSTEDESNTKKVENTVENDSKKNPSKSNLDSDSDVGNEKNNDTEATEKNTEDNSHGVKRKNDETEDRLIKVAKAEDDAITPDIKVGNE